MPRKARKQKQEEAQERPKVERASIVRDGLLIETVFDPKTKPPMQYVIFRDSQPSKLLYRPDAQFGQFGDAEIFTPPPNRYGIVESGCVRLASHPLAYNSQSQLREEIRAFIHRYVQIPEMAEEVATWYVFMTWVFDRFSAVPYLRFLDPHGSGKTRRLQAIGSLSYKGIFAGGAASTSPIFRLLDLYRGTLILDEADFRNSDAWVDIIKILNQGYSEGFPVLRSEKSDTQYDPRPFHVYGPKIIANRSRYDDPALESRCLTFEVPEEEALRDDIPRQLPPEFHSEAQALRDKLLMWRFENYRRIVIDESKLLKLEPRLTQIGAAIYSVAEDQDFRERFVRFLEKSEAADRQQRPQAIVVEAVKQLASGDGTALAVKEVAQRAEQLAEEYATGEGFSAKRTGGILRSLGFRPARARDGYRFPVDGERLKRLAVRYGLEP